MNIRTLRTVLLIQSIEESDRDGDVLPLADRAEATRTAAREAPRGQAFHASEGRVPSEANASGNRRASGAPGAGLSRPANAFLARRSQLLLARVRLRSPAVDHVLAIAGGLHWVGRVLLILALLLGMSLSALDGSRKINILSFPLIGLIAWNLFVYLLLIAARFKRPATDAAGGFWSGHFYERWIGRRIESLLKQSTRFNAPLATGLRRFTAEWTAVEHPLLMERVKRLMHLAGALLAVGLIAGLYIRGIALRFEAGWESTFLGPATVQALLVLFYGPAAALSGIGLPAKAGIEALRWTGASGGGEAASWIHLIAITAMLYVVMPRLLLAAVSGFNLLRLSRRPPLPPSVLGYARTLLVGAAGGIARESAGVTCFAYEPGPESVAGLRTLLSATLGGIVKVEMRAAVRYGEEEEFREELTRRGSGASNDSIGDWSVLLMSVASTPEAENHGAVIAAARDWIARTANATPLLVIVDTGPYAARMQGDASLDQRLKERRALWTDFVAGYGLRACIVDLTRIVAGAPSEIEARELARAALWTA